MILCDTGVLFCLVDQSQPQHQAYIDLDRNNVNPARNNCNQSPTITNPPPSIVGANCGQ
jgi:predicted nucleic acid-binding protein